MNELRLKRIQRWLQGIDIRLCRSSSYKYSYDSTNFPSLKRDSTVTIMDVGANIGQSSLWFAESFPNAKIFAFEPLPSVYNSLISNTKSIAGIVLHNCAIGGKSEKIRIPIIESDSIQTVQVLGLKEKILTNSVEIDVFTIDEMANKYNLPRISILKTDTEGSDLEVLKGAEAQLKQKNISYILSEVTIHQDDNQHTNLFAMMEYLRGFGYDLYSLYDLKHDPDGKLTYFNALFAVNNSNP